MWPSIRAFWLSSVRQYSAKTYIVFDDQRLTYGEVHERAVKAATVFRDVYGVRKGPPPCFVPFQYHSLAHFRRPGRDMFPQLPRISNRLLGLPYVDFA